MNLPPVGAMRPQAGGGLDDNPASEGDALASGTQESSTVVVDLSAAESAGLEDGYVSSDDDVDPDPRRDLRAEAFSTKHLSLIHI